MIEIQKSATFDRWMRSLKDLRAKARIEVRLDRLALGQKGDSKSIGEGIYELRFDYGPGYRIYYTQHGEIVIILLCGGDKSSQARDIQTAKRLARDWSNANG